MKLTEDQANQIWDVLIDLCQAPPDNGTRQQFVSHCVTSDEVEFRFQGSLGFGGKLYYAPRINEAPRVGYYPEDRTKTGDLVVAKANEHLDTLWREWKQTTAAEMVQTFFGYCGEIRHDCKCGGVPGGCHSCSTITTLVEMVKYLISCESNTIGNRFEKLERIIEERSR